MQKPVKIALLGMDQRSAKIITMTLEQKASRVCSIVDISHADVALIDMDSANHQDELDSVRRSYSTLPIIATSIKTLNVKDVYFLRKPLSLPNLINLFRQIFGVHHMQKAAGDGIAAVEDSKQNTGSIAEVLDTRVQVKQVNVTSYSTSDELFFDPKQFTLEIIKTAVEKSKKSKKQIVVKFWDGKTILVDAQFGKILTNITRGQMRTLGVVNVDNSNAKVKIKTADPTTLFDFDPKFNSSIRVTTIDELLWHLAYITARGRIPNILNDDVAFNLQEPVYISEWPNFTRMAPIPHAARIVAFWIRQPSTLCQLAKLLNVDQEHVNGLFFACHSIGIAGQGTRQSDNIVEPNLTQKHKHRSLFGAILGHLKGRASA